MTTKRFFILLIIALLLLWLPLGLHAEIIRTNIPTGTTAVRVLPETLRQWLVLRCPATNTVSIYVSLEGSTNVTTDTGSFPGIPIAPGNMLIWTGAEEGREANDAAIYAVHGSAGTELLIIQTR